MIILTALEGAGELTAAGRWDMENRGDIKSGCKGVLLRNSGRSSGVWMLRTDSGRTGSVRTLQLNSARTGRTGSSDDVPSVRTQ